jgi:hypothetical protein
MLCGCIYAVAPVGKSNVLLPLMNNIDEFEDQEQSKFDAVDLRRHREQFRGQREKANVEASAERVPSTGV